MKSSFLKITMSILLFASLGGGSLFLYYRMNEERNNMIEDLDKRALIISRSLAPEAQRLLRKQLPDSASEQEEIAERLSGKGRTLGIVLCRADGEMVARTSTLDAYFGCREGKIQQALGSKDYKFYWEERGNLSYHEIVYPLLDKNGFQASGVLVVIHEASYIQKRFFKGIFWNLLFLALMVFSGIFLTSWILRKFFQKSLLNFANWAKSSGSEEMPEEEFLKPVSKEFRKMAARLHSAQKIAEEISHEIEGKDHWNAARLKAHVISHLGDKPFIAVSNREPYIHSRYQGQRKVTVPAGGLVSALDPVLKATNGLWVAHGSGDADREVTDAEGKLMVPPSMPSYTLKRVWLTKEEEEGYYYGFSNETLWPLCHLTHHRPEFDPQHWEIYKKVNYKFAKSLLNETGKNSPFVLVQDYHFTLLPEMVRQGRPDVKLGLFWHIPWPHPEMFQICPWHEEILRGMLGANMIGFHFQSYCNRFLETVNQLLPVKLDWDKSVIYHKGGETYVKPFPIGIQPWEERFSFSREELELKINQIRSELDLNAQSQILLSVDRLDYTKGILERLRAIDLFVEKNPQYKGKVCFIQLGAPSRVHIPKYRDLISEVEALCDHVNWKHAEDNWKPILFLKDQHSPEKVYLFMRMAHSMIVSSLADGMNLVAKEFVAAREDEKGVLILSEFAGAAKELEEALIINPYSQEDFAKAIVEALNMDEAKQRKRMQQMRKQVHEENVYKWAGSLVSELNKLGRSEKKDLLRFTSAPLKLIQGD